MEQHHELFSVALQTISIDKWFAWIDNAVFHSIGLLFEQELVSFKNIPSLKLRSFPKKWNSYAQSRARV